MNTNTNHLLRYLYSFDEDVSRLNGLYQTVQQNNDPWSNFIRGFDFPVEENGLLDLDRSFNFEISIIEPESVESTNNEMPQADQENFFSIDNHDNPLRNLYLVDEVNTQLDHMEQQNNDIWSDFIGGSDLPIPNEENTWLDLERSF
ncbi:7761_t:CDS:1, partial [Ambispora leptoticha]